MVPLDEFMSRCFMADEPAGDAACERMVLIPPPVLPLNLDTIPVPRL